MIRINGKKIKELREGLGLTAASLADSVGLSQSMIAHTENGLKVPNAIILGLIAERLGVTVDELLIKENV